jgi:hypothetical protein
VIQVGGFDLLFGWAGFIALLVILGSLVLRSRADVFKEANRRTSDPNESSEHPPSPSDGLRKALRDGALPIDYQQK